MRRVLAAQVESRIEQLRDDRLIPFEAFRQASEYAQKLLDPLRQAPEDAMSEPGPPSSETELRVQLAEARTDTKFAEMLGEVRIGFAKMDGRFGEIEARMGGLERSTSGIKATVIGTGIAVVALVIAVMTYGQTWFGIGVSTRDVVKAAVTEYRQRTTPPNAH